MSALRLLAFVLASVSVLALGSIADAQKAKKKKKDADVGPAVGTWSVTIQGRAANLVFLERHGPRTIGYFDMSPSGPMKAVAVVGAVVDPTSHVLSLTSREIHTTVPSIVPPQVEGTLSPDGKRIEKMKSLVNAGAPQGTGVWLRAAAPPPPMPSVAASLVDTSDRSLLYQQCSGDFLIGDVRITHATLRPLLAHLEQSADPHIRSLAKTRRAFQDMFDLAIAEAAAKDRAGEADALRAELWKFVGKALANDDNSFKSMKKQISGVMESDPIKNIFLREKKAAHLACMREITVLAIQRHVRTDFEARKVAPLAKADGLVIGVKVDGNGFGAVTIRNDTGRDLHHCFIAPKLTIDQAKMDALEKEFRKDAAQTYALASAFGAKMKAAADADEYVLLFNRLDKGSNNYLSAWKQGATLQIDLAQPDAIKKIGAAVSVWVGSDEGQAERPIDIGKVKSEIALQQPKELHTVDSHGIGSSKDLAFSPNGKWLASAGPNPIAIVWEAATGKEQGKFFGLGTAQAVAFHPNNNLLAVGDDSGRIHLLNVETMKELGQPLKHVPPAKSITGSAVEAVAFSKDGKLLASGSADKTVKIWNVQNGQAIATLPHPSYVRSLAFSPDGATLASGCADSNIRLWNVAKKETTATFEGHKTPVIALAFHPAGKTLASGSMDGLVKLWEVATAKNPSDVVTNARNISLAFSPDGKRLATGGDLRGVQIFDPESGTTLFTMSAVSGPVAFGPAGKFATAWRDTKGALGKGKVKIWELP